MCEWAGGLAGAVAIEAWVAGAAARRGGPPEVVEGVGVGAEVVLPYDAMEVELAGAYGSYASSAPVRDVIRDPGVCRGEIAVVESQSTTILSRLGMDGVAGQSSRIVLRW